MQVMIRCRVRPDGVEADLELLQEMYEEMRAVQPKGLRYATYGYHCGRAFLHAEDVLAVRGERTRLDTTLEATRADTFTGLPATLTGTLDTADRVAVRASLVAHAEAACEQARRRVADRSQRSRRGTPARGVHRRHRRTRPPRPAGPAVAEVLSSPPA